MKQVVSRWWFTGRVTRFGQYASPGRPDVNSEGGRDGGVGTCGVRGYCKRNDGGDGRGRYDDEDDDEDEDEDGDKDMKMKMMMLMLMMMVKKMVATVVVRIVV
jgi:hypothetical protein